MGQEESTARVNREAYFQIWGEAPPGDLPSVIEQQPAPRAISDAPRPKELRDQTVTRLTNDLEILTKRMESVFNSLKTTMERVEQAQLSQRDELKALSRRLGVSLERRRMSESSKRSASGDGARRERVVSPSTRPPSFFAAALPRARTTAGRSGSLLIGIAIGVLVLLLTALLGLGSSSSAGFAVTGVNVLLGFGFGLVTVGILLRQRARRKVRRRPPI
jgi:hypothetical protein